MAEDLRDTTDGDVLDVGQLCARVENLLKPLMKGASLTVRGEVMKFNDRGRHLYFDLADTGDPDAKNRAVIGVHCWEFAWRSLRAKLAESGAVVSEGAVVTLEGHLDLYAPGMKLGFNVTGIDISGLLGDMARRRQELIERLRLDGTLEANKARTLSPVPLRLGLVASKGTEGFNDFWGQLRDSGYAFEVTHVQTTVQGDQAPAQVVRALRQLDALGLDAICIVRGGGSKNDLACFDDERIARAIGACATPVLTGIGHTGDQSVADLCAFHAAITPTKLGEGFVTKVREWERRNVAEPRDRLNADLAALLAEARAYLDERRRTVVFAVRDRLRGEERHLGGLRTQLHLQCAHVLRSADQWLGATRQLLAAYDPQRRLAQGWALVTTPAGRPVASVAAIRSGDEVTVLLGDGSFDAQVLTTKGTT
jgi:exodeoxyribonuclease VII large subunit